MTWPGAGRLTFPRSMIAKTPKPTVTIPIKRTLVPKSEIVIASSHGIANTKSQRKANANLPRTEDPSAPARERTAPLLSGLGGAEGRRCIGANLLIAQPKQLRHFLNNSSPRPRESAEVSHLNHRSLPSRFRETDLNQYGVVLIQPLRWTYECVFAWLRLEL